MEKTDITIIGAGIIGLSVSYILSSLGKEIVVLEKNHSFGQETSSRNSEVIHSGIYYPKNSLKSKTCIRGKELLYKLCKEHDIKFKKTGKILVSEDENETQKLNEIYKNATDCGVRNLRFLKKKELKSLEPDIKATQSLFSPDAGIVDTHGLMNFFYGASKRNKVNFAFSVEVIDIIPRGSSYEIVVQEPQGDYFTFDSKVVINCGGLFSDNVAKMVGLDIDKYSYKLHYCKGQYFRLKSPNKFSIQHLVYPPPRDTDLGIHITPDLEGGLRLGPDAQYVSDIEYNVKETEKNKFFDSAVKFLPSLDSSDLIPDTAGIRPKLHDSTKKFADFIVQEEADKGFPNFINTIGIESPGLTSCLAIAEIIKDLVGKSSKTS